jgi:4-hydroxy-tetrahydrodipicolinate reductase
MPPCSRLERVLPQIEEILSLGYHCVSSCEELAYPYLRHPELASRLDEQPARPAWGSWGRE